MRSQRCRRWCASVLVALLAAASGGCGGGDGAAGTDPGTPPPAPPPTTEATTTTTTEATTTSTTTTVPPPPPTGGHCVGDSVMLGAGPGGHGALPACAVVDAVVSRQASAAPSLAAAAAAASPPFVVIHLGTNGTIDPAVLDAALAELSGVGRVVLVTVQLAGSRSWEEPNNAILRAAPARFDNVVVADWDAASEGRPELLADDFGHLTAAGAALYATVIAYALAA